MRFAASSDRGRARERNEDAYCCVGLDGRPGVALLAVADGVGGHPGGEVASRLAMAALRARVEGGADSASSWGELLQAAIADADAAVLREEHLRPELAGMATTMTAAVLADERVYWGHVGDSRAYLIGRDGLHQLTTDHSPVGELVREGLLARADAAVHPMRHVLSRALGFDSALPADAGEQALAAGEWLVLATDGLSAVVRPEEIAGAAATAAGPEELVADLVALAVQRGGPDNVTVVAALAP